KSQAELAIRRTSLRIATETRPIRNSQPIVHLMGVHLVGMCLIDVYLMGVHLIGVNLMGRCLMGVYLMGVHLICGCLIGVHLMSVYLIGVYYRRTSRRMSHGRASD